MMKEWIKKISVSLMLAVCELLLGILLLVNPVGLTSFVIVALGVLLLLLGALHLFQYTRLPREEAAKTWKLASGAGLHCAGSGVYEIADRGGRAAWKTSLLVSDGDQLCCNCGAGYFAVHRCLCGKRRLDCDRYRADRAGSARCGLFYPGPHEKGELK